MKGGRCLGSQLELWIGRKPSHRIMTVTCSSEANRNPSSTDLWLPFSRVCCCARVTEPQDGARLDFYVISGDRDEMRRRQRGHHTPVMKDWLVCRLCQWSFQHTLWWTNIAMENHHFKWENPLFLWPFSIAMLVHQRVVQAMAAGKFRSKNGGFPFRWEGHQWSKSTAVGFAAVASHVWLAVEGATLTPYPTGSSGLPGLQWVLDGKLPAAVLPKRDDDGGQ